MKTFFKSLGAAAAGGAVTSVTHAIATTGSIDPKANAAVAIAGALVGVFAYLMQSPFGAQIAANVVQQLPTKK